MITPEQIKTLIQSYEFRFANEKELQAAVEMIFEANGVEFKREVKLNAKDIIDFLIAKEKIGIEIKIGFGYSAVIRQLHRYAQSYQIEKLMLITTRAGHQEMPAEINGKALTVINLSLRHSL